MSIYKEKKVLSSVEYIDDLVKQFINTFDYRSISKLSNNKLFKAFFNKRTIPLYLYGTYKQLKKLKEDNKETNQISITLNNKKNSLYAPTLSYLASQTSFLVKKEDNIEIDYGRIGYKDDDLERDTGYSLTNYQGDRGGSDEESTTNDYSVKEIDTRVKSLYSEVDRAFIPQDYVNTFSYKGSVFTVSKFSADRESNKKILGEEMIEFQIDKKGRDDLRDFFEEVITYHYNTNLLKGLRVFSANSWGGWEKVSEDLDKDLEGVFIDQEDKDYIIKDIDDFLKKKEKLKSKGIPYKRNFLFHGISGTGKTTLIKALATRYRKDIYFFSMNRTMDNNDFISTINDIEEGSFIVIEEVDVLFNQREKKEGNVSFDVFINALDGVVSKEDCMIFMTTNHIDNIDEALMRPGRVDTQLEFKEGQFTHFKAMAEYLYDIKLTVGQENRLAQLLGLHKTYKHALIQNFFIKYDTFDEMVKEKEVFEKFRERYN